MAEVPIKTFAEVPVVRTADQLYAAAGCLATSLSACVLDLDAACLDHFGDTSGLSRYEGYGEIPGQDYRTLRALERALLDATDSTMRWIFQGEGHGSDEAESDFDFHTDPSPGDGVSINYHETGPLSAVEITFAIPEPPYDVDEDAGLLTRLLRRGLTDSSLVDPQSFRRVRFDHGGKLAFTLGISGKDQLHDFRTLSPHRTSLVWYADGYTTSTADGDEDMVAY
jgi:hypothetical protein